MRNWERGLKKDKLYIIGCTPWLTKRASKSLILKQFTNSTIINGANTQHFEILENVEKMRIPAKVVKTDIFEVAYSQDRSPCFLCAKMRRGALYTEAQKRGCNKIALGHHFSDVIETTVMSMFYGSQLQGMIPMLHSQNYGGMTLIRPLYCIHEQDIISWKNYNELQFIQCACRFTENCTICDNGGGGSKRQEIKQLIKKLKQTNPNIEKSIFNAIHSVCIETFPGFKAEGESHSFLERFEKEK